MSTRTKAVLVLILVAGSTGVGCARVSESAQSLRERIEAIDIDATLDGLRDCDRLSDAFVGLVKTAADAVDGLAEQSGGRLPAVEIREFVDKIAVSQYFDIAEQIGCLEVRQKLDTLDRLRGVEPDTPAGTEFLDEILRQVEAQR